jgi:aspartate kinase
VPVDTVSTSEVSVSLTVDSRLNISNVLADLSAFTDVETEPGKAIVCVIGDDLRGTPGTLARVSSTLGDVNIRMVTQGASEINISFVIEEKDVPEAVRRLHRLVLASWQSDSKAQGAGANEA